jgi:hypothetical protein
MPVSEGFSCQPDRDMRYGPLSEPKAAFMSGKVVVIKPERAAELVAVVKIIRELGRVRLSMAEVLHWPTGRI